jgi:two-component system, sensor histidine kinase LadS
MSDAPRTIAIVDDDPDTLLLAAAVLAAAGHRVITDDGSRGLADRLASAPPDLVLLDLQLEGRNGEDALHEIRADDRLDRVRIMGFSAALPGDPQLARIRNRLVGHIAKPVDPAALASAVQRAFSTAPEPVPTTAPPDPDLEALRQQFLDGLPARADRIIQALANNNTDQLVLEIHRLRGAAGAYGLHDLAGSAANAEHLLQTDDADAPPALARLIDDIRNARE